jgi:hypothetical protein
MVLFVWLFRISLRAYRHRRQQRYIRARIALTSRSPKQQTPFASTLDHTATKPAGMASIAESLALSPPSNWMGDSVAVNRLIVGTDAHAKNYALLIGAQGRPGLAPLYDVASILPYTQTDIKKTKLSMKLDGEYCFSSIQGSRWLKMAQDIRLEPDTVIQRGRLCSPIAGSHRRHSVPNDK